MTEAENGEDELARVEAARPGIVLLDLTLPVMDGFTFLQRLRARPDSDAVPVVVLTALNLSRENRRGLAGAIQILHKGDISLRAVAENLHRPPVFASRGNHGRRRMTASVGNGLANGASQLHPAGLHDYHELLPSVASESDSVGAIVTGTARPSHKGQSQNRCATPAATWKSGAARFSPTNPSRSSCVVGVTR